jgi:hypothetical protein
VDQAEELFAAEGQEESQEFLALMAETLERRAKSNSDDAMSGRRALAVMCIRSDFLQRLQTEGSLQHVSPYLFSLPPVARTEFKTVIEGPAAVHRQSGRLLRIDSALTEKLLEDAR